MKQFEAKQVELCGHVFHVRPLPAFKAANISGELFGALLPALASVAPLAGGKGAGESLMDLDGEAAAAFAKGMAGLSGDRVERLLKALLTAHRNVLFEPIEQTRKKAPKPQMLTEDAADEIFCGEAHAMFMLAFEVVRGNYGGFFGKLGGLFGGRAAALKELAATMEGPESTES